MNNDIDHGLSPGELRIVRNILSPYQQHIDKVGIFGSRANGNYKEYSDIDLVLYGNLAQQDLARLHTLFDESQLGVRVDINAYHLIAYPPLKRHIDSKHKTLFTGQDLHHGGELPSATLRQRSGGESDSSTAVGERSRTPELRFPEFRDKGEWEVKRIDEIADVVASGDLDKESFSPQMTDEHVFPIYSNSVSNEGLYGYNNYSKYQPNSITITARGTLGVAFVRNTEFVGIGRLLVVSELRNIDPIFLKENWNQYARIPLENGGIPQLTAIKTKSVSLLFPEFEEQQKIADCLSSLDDLIGAHIEKREVLKAHKRGLMQQLFPPPPSTTLKNRSGGESDSSTTVGEPPSATLRQRSDSSTAVGERSRTPALRFPEFRDSGAWEEKELGMVSDVRDGTHDSPRFVSTGMPLVTSKNLLADGSLDLGNVNLISNKDYEKINKRSNVNVGDILFGMIGTIGNPVLVESDEFAIKNVALIKEKNELLNEYLVYLLDSQYMFDKFQMLATGNTQKFIALGKIRSLVVPLPVKKEQQKIASCLSSLDELITAQSEKIAQLQQHKKGLLQQLFPRVTGE